MRGEERDDESTEINALAILGEDFDAGLAGLERLRLAGKVAPLARRLTAEQKARPIGLESGKKTTHGAFLVALMLGAKIELDVGAKSGWCARSRSRVPLVQGPVMLARLGLTQETIAARVGVSHAAVSHWLNGKRKPGPAKREKLFVSYGIPEAAWSLRAGPDVCPCPGCRWRACSGGCGARWKGGRSRLTRPWTCGACRATGRAAKLVASRECKARERDARRAARTAARSANLGVCAGGCGKAEPYFPPWVAAKRGGPWRCHSCAARRAPALTVGEILRPSGDDSYGKQRPKLGAQPRARQP